MDTRGWPVFDNAGEPPLSRAYFEVVATRTAASTAFTVVGTSNTNSGTPTNQNDLTAAWRRFQSSSGTPSGMFTNVGPADWLPDVAFYIKTGAALPDNGLIVALSDLGGVSNATDFGSTYGAGIRYSTANGDSDGTWRVVTNDGSLSPNVANTGLSIAINTPYMFRIQFVSTSLVNFYHYSGGGWSLISRQTTQIPSGSAWLYANLWVDETGGSARYISVNRIVGTTFG